MSNFYKALDHYRKLHRAGSPKIFLANDNGNYWLCDGYTMHKIPATEMELSPKIFSKMDIPYKDIIKKAESGVALKSTGLIHKSGRYTKAVVPFVSDGSSKFTIWFYKSLLALFPEDAALIGTGPLQPAAVKDCGQTIRIILPCRQTRDIDIYQFVGGKINA